jgi:hypothetical protein
MHLPIGTAEGALAPISHPVAQFVASGKSLTACERCAVNGNYSPIVYADDIRLAAGQRFASDERTTGVCNRVDVDIVRLGDSQRFENLFRGGRRFDHFSSEN